MKVSLVFDFSIDERKALGAIYGADTMRHDDLRRWMYRAIRADLDSIVHDHRRDNELNGRGPR